MPAYLVLPDPGTGGQLATRESGVEGFVVFADTAPSALAICKAVSQFPSDASIDAATVTEIADLADMEGFRLRCMLYDPATNIVVEDVTITGGAGDDFDDLGDAMATALNLTASIANAAYATPNLTVAAAADGLGDMALVAQLLPPETANDPTIQIEAGIGAIVDQGVAAADVTVVLNDIATPHVYAAGKLAS